jgi:eukaryotic-like serine/threonine-protein kinase
MGQVHLANDPDLDRRVALKLVRADEGDAAAAILRDRLWSEARLLARVDHPNVCRVYDVGRTETEVWVAMELLDGVSLRAAVARARGDVNLILALFTAAGRGLAAAHAAGLVHRDFKPENVLVTAAGRVVVTDFGLARDAAGGTTATGAIVGTPAYMAPEQRRGRSVDARADQYAFGVALHDALEGLAAPGYVRAAVDRATRLEPALRFPTMAALLAALARPRRALDRWPLWVAASLGVVVGVVALGLVWSRPTPTRASPAPSRQETAIGVARETANLMGDSIAWLADRADDEQARRGAQIERLDQTVAEAQRAIREGRLDDAELKAATISWAPITSPNNHGDKGFIERYDRERETLQAIIKRRRGLPGATPAD